MKPARFSVDTPAILREIAASFSSGSKSDSPGIVMACSEISAGLHAIGKRALELGDEVILEELKRLCVIRPVEGGGDEQ